MAAPTELNLIFVSISGWLRWSVYLVLPAQIAIATVNLHWHENFASYMTTSKSCSYQSLKSAVTETQICFYF
jgi:hypothetical protein